MLDVTYAVGVLTITGALVAAFRWISKVDANTAATEKLTNVFEKFTERIDQRLTDHEQRISRLEGRSGD